MLRVLVTALIFSSRLGLSSNLSLSDCSNPFYDNPLKTDLRLLLSTYYGGDTGALFRLGHGRTFPQPVSQVEDGILVLLLGHHVDHGIDHDAGPVDHVGKDVKGRVFEANVELIFTTLSGSKKS